MAVNFAPKDYQEDILRIETPSLVLVGKNDESFYPDQFKTVFEPAENWVSVKILQDASHLDVVSDKKTIKEIMNWIKE
ncbi:hypothetical protein [Parapedobacter tibetensis]|uniref:hypothetical protein n=1 Tax=Parapedobacter tibetensis TaxID=2972951 RepID=UPI00214D5A29|nr:hypothetical protein [Parapedobacter tibetensis]